MWEDARPGLEAHPGAGLEPAEGGSSRLIPALAAVAAFVTAAAFVWWFVAPDFATSNAPKGTSLANAPHAAASTPSLRYATAQPDPDQVRRAYQDARHAYVQGGGEGLVHASATCAHDVSVAPQLLDYCVAFDIYASQIVAMGGASAQADWFRGAAERDLTLARASLPATVNPQNRIAQLTALTRAVVPANPGVEAVSAHPGAGSPAPAAKPERPKFVKASLHRAGRKPHAHRHYAAPTFARRAATGQATDAIDRLIREHPAVSAAPLDPPY